MQEMLELEGCHISSAILSHLTDKGTKSEGHMMIFILVLFPISKNKPLWGILRSHNLWHSFFINFNYKYLHLEAKGIRQSPESISFWQPLCSKNQRS